jgi:hypothetical protein
MLVVRVPNLSERGSEKSADGYLNGGEHRKIRLIESYDKCRFLKKLTCKGTLRQVFYLSEAPIPPLTPYSPLLHSVNIVGANQRDV